MMDEETFRYENIDLNPDPVKLAELYERHRRWCRVLAWPPLVAYPKITAAVRRASESNDEALHSKADAALNTLDTERRAAIKLWVSRSDDGMTESKPEIEE